MRARKTRNDKCECKCEVSQHTLTRNKRWTMDTGYRINTVQTFRHCVIWSLIKFQSGFNIYWLYTAQTNPLPIDNKKSQNFFIYLYMKFFLQSIEFVCLI